MNYKSLLLLLILLISCQKNETNQALLESIAIPSSNFVFQPLKNYEIESIDGDYYMHFPLSTQSPSFIISTAKFDNLYKTRENWISERLNNSNLGNIQEIDINGISGYIADYQGDNSEATTVVKVAVLTTEDEGIFLSANSNPENIEEVNNAFGKILQSIKLNDS